MESFENHSTTEKKEEGIANELLAMAKMDQEARKHWDETGEEWDVSMDKKNTERIKEIVDMIGWPTKTKVGDEASVAAWLLVQHADHDPEFQQKCLDLMKQEPGEEVRKQDVAFLEDRVRVNTARPTLYGTQFYENESGVYGPRPIEDRENLNKRREEVGLGPFEEYEQEMQEINREAEKKSTTDSSDRFS